jgi:hypothetical protein
MRLQARLLRGAHHLDHLAVGHALVGAQLDFGVGVALRGVGQAGGQLLGA